MAEVRTEATYVKHHKKKIAFIFSAMRHFAAELEKQKFNVVYVQYDASDNGGSLFSEVKRTLKTQKLNKLLVTEPGEYRLLKEMRGWSEQLNCEVEILNDNRFIATHAEFQNWANNRKELIMEYWYREMRRKTGLLMDQGKPVGGKWNLDKAKS